MPYSFYRVQCFEVQPGMWRTDPLSVNCGFERNTSVTAASNVTMIYE
jgi:hypothetical protein